MMSFSQLMPGDVLPCNSEGITETWKVVDIKADDTSVELSLKLIQNKVVEEEKERVDPVEYRRQQLFEPHSRIITEVPMEWLND
jgi:hypothetical protein